MNLPHDPHASSDQSGLAARLDRLATAIDLRPGSVDTVRRRGQQRIRRRRTTVGVVSAVAVVGASITGIALLSRPTDPTVANGSGDTTGAVTASGAPTNAQTDATTAPTLAASTAPLELVDPAITWQVVRPGSTEALAYPYVLSGPGPTAGPLYAYSSAPGRSDGQGPGSVLYRSDDGISWSLAESTELPEGTQLVGSLGGEPGALYALATAPAAAAADEPLSATDATNPVLFGEPSGLQLWAQGADGAWSPIDVPLDVAGWLDVPGVLAATAGEYSVSSIGGEGPGEVLVAARTQLALDSSAVADDADGVEILPDTVIVSHFDDGCGGVTETTFVVTDAVAGGATAGTAPAATGAVETPAVETTAPETTAATTEQAAPTTVSSAAVSEGTASACEPTTERRDIAELGVDQRALDEYFGPPHLFRSLPDGTLAEVPFPGTAASGHLIASTRLVSLGDTHALLYDEHDPTSYETAATHLWLSTDGETWVERPLPAQVRGAWSITLGRLADGRIAGTSLWGADPAHPLAFVEASGGWSTTDLAGTLRPDDGVSATLQPNVAVVGDTGITVAALVQIDPIVEHGPVSVTEGDRTISLVDSRGVYVVTDTATGAELGRVDYSLPNAGEDGSLVFEDDGDVVLVDPATGAEIVRVTSDVQNRLGQQAYDRQQASPAVILHSADGTSWSRESLADLGSGGATWINALASVGGKVIGTYLDPGVRNDDGTPATFVLVGTPNG